MRAALRCFFPVLRLDRRPGSRLTLGRRRAPRTRQVQPAHGAWPVGHAHLAASRDANRRLKINTRRSDPAAASTSSRGTPACGSYTTTCKSGYLHSCSNLRMSAQKLVAEFPAPPLYSRRPQAAYPHGFMAAQTNRGPTSQSNGSRGERETCRLLTRWNPAEPQHKHVRSREVIARSLT